MLRGEGGREVEVSGLVTIFLQSVSGCQHEGAHLVAG